MERLPRSSTEEYKLRAVSSGRSITFVAKDIGPRDSVLRRWIDKLREPTSTSWRPTDFGGSSLGTRPAAPGERTAAHGA
jgi:transposase